MTSPQRLPIRTKLAFGVGAGAEAAVSIAFNTWNFLFYNHVLGLSGTLCGLAVTLSLVLDAIADPVVGFMSDRWHSKLGRRHPFLFTAPIPLALSFYCIYVPPAGLTGVALFAWFTFFTILTLVFSGIRNGLLAHPDMHIAGGYEMGYPSWFQDQTKGVIESPSILSVPMWVYRALFFAWASWMAFALVRWLRWAFNAWKNGGLWRGNGDIPRFLENRDTPPNAGRLP